MTVRIIKKKWLISSLNSPCNPFPNDEYETSKPKVLSNDNFIYNENCRKISKWGENTVEKEKLPVTRNFSISQSVFKRLVLQLRQKQGLVWERVNGGYLDFSHFTEKKIYIYH